MLASRGLQLVSFPNVERRRDQIDVSAVAAAALMSVRKNYTEWPCNLRQSIDTAVYY